MKNHCLLLRIHSVLAKAVFVFAAIAVVILIFAPPKYLQRTETDVGIAVIGVPGDKGDKGDKGAVGEKGVKGASGAKGEPGATGATGAKGAGFWGGKP